MKGDCNVQSKVPEPNAPAGGMTFRTVTVTRAGGVAEGEGDTCTAGVVDLRRVGFGVGGGLGTVPVCA